MRNLNRDHPKVPVLRVSKSVSAGDMIHKGRACGDESEMSAAVDCQMNSWFLDTDLAKTTALALIEQKEHEI